MVFFLIIIYSFINCSKRTPLITNNKIEGTWKMVYAEIIENDSLKLKDLSNTSFIKIINKSFFLIKKTQTQKIITVLLVLIF